MKQCRKEPRKHRTPQELLLLPLSGTEGSDAIFHQALRIRKGGSRFYRTMMRSSFQIH
jgi:hypothetical protein